MRHFVVVGQRARSTPDFLLDDLPGTSGRLDVLVGCLRAGLMVSHGVRANACVHLVLLGGPVPTVLRFRGNAARFLRPDERSLATLVRKCLQVTPTEAFVEVRPGIDLALGDLSVVLASVGTAEVVVLDASGADIRTAPLALDGMLYVLGDDRGLTTEVLALLDQRGARRVSVGPLSLQAADAMVLVHNELDRRDAMASPS